MKPCKAARGYSETEREFVGFKIVGWAPQGGPLIWTRKWKTCVFDGRSSGLLMSIKYWLDRKMWTGNPPETTSLVKLR